MKKQLAGIALATAFLFGYMEKPAAAEAFRDRCKRLITIPYQIEV